MTSERVGNGKKRSRRVRLSGPRLQKHLERLLTVLICVCVREKERETESDTEVSGAVDGIGWSWVMVETWMESRDTLRKSWLHSVMYWLRKLREGKELVSPAFLA